MRRLYPALVDRKGEAYEICFPDFPGFVAVGRSPEEAIAEGAEALGLHVAAMVANGDALPTPTPLGDVEMPAKEEAVVAVTLVPVIIPGRARTIEVTLDESLIDEIDNEADDRSAFIAEAARAALARRGTMS